MSTHDESARDTLDAVFRAEYPALLATLARRAGGDLIAAEDALGEAFAEATRAWSEGGVPDAPAAWLVTVAARRLVDGARRTGRGVDDGDEVVRAAQQPQQPDVEHEFLIPDEHLGGVDDRLRLVFTCCHPALELKARVALTLNALGGLTAHAIARAFVVNDATMAQRLVRAKTKIRDANIPFALPPEGLIAERLDAVLRVVYLIFNAGDGAGAGDSVERQGLVRDALRLAALLVELVPADSEVLGLLALLELTRARSAARIGLDGELVLLPDQDRSLWDAEAIARGTAGVEAALAACAGRPGRYAVQAAIAAVHAEAPRASDTDWRQIVALYDLLFAVEPTPVVALNRAVARAEVDGPAVGLADVERLVAAGELDGYLYLHATRADLLRRVGRTDEARAAYARAIELADDPVERRFLLRRLYGV